MRTIRIVMLNQFVRTLRMRGVLLNMFLLPLILIFLLGTALKGADNIGKGDRDITFDPVTLAVVGPSDSSSLVGGYLGEAEIAKFMKPVAVSDRPQAESMLRSGQADYALVVPSGFDQTVAEGGSGELELIRGKNESDNQIAEQILNPFVNAINDRSAAAKLLGPAALAVYEKQPIPDSPLRKGAIGAQGESYTSFQYYAASMLTMFMMYAGLTLSGSLNGERENRTLQRLYAMPLRPLELFAGKVLAAGAVAMLQALIIIAFSGWVYGVDWGAQPLMLAAVCLLMIVFTMGMAVAATLLTTSQAQSDTIIQVVIVAMTFLSGGFFPFEGWLQRLGSFTVSHWASESLLRMMLHVPSAQVGSSLAVLAAISGAFLLLALALYAKRGYSYE